jgi:hypothetical protein
MKREILKFLNTNENGNTTYPNLWGTPKAELKGNFRTMSTYMKKEKK